MLKLLPDFPNHVIAVRASGYVTGKEYKTVLVPVDTERRRTHTMLNLYYVFAPDYAGMDISGMWEDTKLDLRHWRGWRRIAIVSDNNAIRKGAAAAARYLRRPVRVFSLAEAPAGRAWVTEPIALHQ